MTQTYSQARMLPGRSPVALVTAGLHVGAFLLFAGASGWVPTPRDVGPTLGFVIDRPTADPLVPPPPLPREASGSELLGESLPLPPEDSTDATLPTLPSAPAATAPVPAATGAGDPPAASPVETPLGYRVRRSQDLFYPPPRCAWARRAVSTSACARTPRARSAGRRRCCAVQDTRGSMPPPSRGRWQACSSSRRRATACRSPRARASGCSSA
jgi:hypothetical protein